MPKKYVEKVGEEGYKKAPVGAGPYKFVSFAPGVELVMEACEGYWRKTPSVTRVFKVISDESTRLAALKRGEVEAIAGYLQQVGIRTKLISRERASHWSTYADKKYKNLAYTDTPTRRPTRT